MKLYEYWLGLHPLDWEFCFMSVQTYKNFITEQYHKNTDFYNISAGSIEKVLAHIDVKSNMVYTLCKHMVYMLSITNEHKNELEMRAKPEWKVHFLCFASAKRGSFSIR